MPVRLGWDGSWVAKGTQVKSLGRVGGIRNAGLHRPSQQVVAVGGDDGFGRDAMLLLLLLLRLNQPRLVRSRGDGEHVARQILGSPFLASAVD